MLSSRLLSLFALAGLSCHAFAAQDIAPQPVGWLGRTTINNTEQDDFMFFEGPGRGNAFIRKLFFTSKIRSLPKGAELRALFVQPLQVPNTFGEYFKTFDEAGRNSAPVAIAAYVLSAGKEIGEFLRTTGTFGDSPRNGLRYNRIFFHVPGRGYLSTEGGRPPLLIRPEVATRPDTEVVAGTIRASDYRFDNVDQTAQARLFLAAKDPRKGRKVFISAGSAATTTLLAESSPGASGTDPDQFATIGTQTVEPNTFYVAKSKNDGDTPQVFRIYTQTSNGRTQYLPAAFTTGLYALPGKPENLKANQNDLFFTAPNMAGGVPELWHLGSNNVSITALERITDGGAAPQDITFSDKEPTFGNVVMSVLQNGVRRYASYDNFDHTVSVLDTTTHDPYEITDAGSNFYYAATSNTSAYTFLLRHEVAGNTLNYISGPGNSYPYNIGEIEAVSVGATGGTLYFTADIDISNVHYSQVLFKMPANTQNVTKAQFCSTLSGQLVTGAHNLRAVANNGSPGIYRLYFTAEVSRSVNSEFFPATMPASVSTLGTKPWVTEVP